MDELPKFLQYIPLMLKPGHYIINSHQHSADLRVDAIGYHFAHRFPVSHPWGIPAWRVMLFHHGMTVQLGGVPHVITPHTLFVIPPHVSSQYGLTGQRWAHSWLRLSGRSASSMIHQANLPISQPIVFGNGQASDFWLEAMDHQVRQTMPVDEHTLRTLLQLWLRKIAHQAAPNADDTLIPHTFRQAHHRITTGYTQKLSLDELAAQVHLSPRYFCTRFKRYYGITPINLAIALRLTHARELLADVNLSITQIAMQTGFTDVYYFSRLFKQQSQLTPSQYRRSLSKQSSETL